jgi:uncharacterized coiled-coil DUF342 family protein
MRLYRKLFTFALKKMTMKTITKITTAALFLAITVLGTSCGNNKPSPEETRKTDSLVSRNSGLHDSLTEKEAAMQEFINAFNEIQTNLNEIKEKEKIVTNATQEGDVKSKEGQIQQDIQSIYDLMNKNKARVASLSKKLKTANTKIDGLEQMITNLNAQLSDKDVQIGDLKNKVEQLNIELSTLNTNYQNVEQDNQTKTQQLNTAYYVIGTSKELKEKGITDKEGGVLGMGKTTELKKDFNKDHFTKIDVTQTMSIPIGAKKIKILTNHPTGSYNVVGEKPVQKIDITNATDFWGTSKYLVIVIE